MQLAEHSIDVLAAVDELVVGCLNVTIRVIFHVYEVPYQTAGSTAPPLVISIVVLVQSLLTLVPVSRAWVVEVGTWSHVLPTAHYLWLLPLIGHLLRKRLIALRADMMA